MQTNLEWCKANNQFPENLDFKIIERIKEAFEAKDVFIILIMMMVSIDVYIC
jgi:hypothetical protein